MDPKLAKGPETKGEDKRQHRLREEEPRRQQRAWGKLSPSWDLCEGSGRGNRAGGVEALCRGPWKGREARRQGQRPPAPRRESPAAGQADRSFFFPSPLFKSTFWNPLHFSWNVVCSRCSFGEGLLVMNNLLLCYLEIFLFCSHSNKIVLLHT